MLNLEFKLCGCQGHRPTATLPLDDECTAYIEKTGETFALMLLRNNLYDSGPYLELSETALETRLNELRAAHG